MKRQRPCKHGVDDYTSGPDIDLLLVTVFVEDLWGHISWGAARFKHKLTRDYDLAETEISDFDLVHFMVRTFLV
jgi:hypothetical protein